MEPPTPPTPPSSTPPTLTSVQNGWNGGIFTISNQDQNDDSHLVKPGKPFTGKVQLSDGEVRFYFSGTDPAGKKLANQNMFSLVYKGVDDVVEIWWGGDSKKNDTIPVSGASKLLLNIEAPACGVLGVILLDDSVDNKFWKNYYGITGKV